MELFGAGLPTSAILVDGFSIRYHGIELPGERDRRHDVVVVEGAREGWLIWAVEAVEAGEEADSSVFCESGFGALGLATMLSFVSFSPLV
mgnify:FL=1